MCLLLGTFCMFLVLVTNLGVIIKTAKQLPIGFVICNPTDRSGKNKTGDVQGCLFPLKWLNYTTQH